MQEPCQLLKKIVKKDRQNFFSGKFSFSKIFF